MKFQLPAQQKNDEWKYLVRVLSVGIGILLVLFLCWKLVWYVGGLFTGAKVADAPVTVELPPVATVVVGPTIEPIANQEAIAKIQETQIEWENEQPYIRAEDYRINTWTLEVFKGNILVGKCKGSLLDIMIEPAKVRDCL